MSTLCFKKIMPLITKYLYIAVVSALLTASSCSKYNSRDNDGIVHNLGFEFIYVKRGEITFNDIERISNPWSPWLKSKALIDSLDLGDTVTIDTDYYILKREVTLDQWESIMGNHKNPKFIECNSGDCPVTNISYKDIFEFITRLNNIDKSGKYRLPTEVEWQYACHLSTASLNIDGAHIKHLNDYTWYSKNSDGAPHPTGLKEPDLIGLYDMLGNVYEATSTCIYETVSGSNNCYKFVARGGGATSLEKDISCSNRYANNNNGNIGVGFRLIKEL